ncbi:MAG: 50S ribosomal protein L11 methyltransferase [Thermodesulfobacteriota bacterium]|nr:50S ribosomal protein L11 methyltransferase [Thermodesulfobacteriota bacterium]
MTQDKSTPDDSTPYWLKSQLKIDPTLEEAVVDFLVGVMGAGVEQAVDTDDPDLCLNVYLEDQSPDEQSQQQLQNKLETYLIELAKIFQVKQPQISWELLEDQDWSNNWKVHFTPFEITPGLVIAPTWEKYTARQGEQVIVMDPGMAFGTGHHATTSLSLDFIRQILSTNRESCVLDVGTGTGILGMGAALFGAARVLGIDNDPEAVRAATENVLLNNLNLTMEVTRTPLQEIQERFSLIVANIIHDVLITMNRDFNKLLEKNGNLVLSGILHGEQEKNILRLFEKSGFTFEGRAQQDEWAALHFRKTS